MARPAFILFGYKVIKGFWVKYGLFILLLIAACRPAGWPAPTGFKAEVVSPSEVRLSWNRVSGATGYVLERRVDGQTYATVLEGFVHEYSDTGLIPNTPYEYRLRSKSSSGASTLTTGVKATTQSAVLPTPTGFNATAVSSSTIILSWNAVSGANGYRIERRTGSANFVALLDNVASTNFQDSTLSPNTKYDYRLTAKSTAGDSAAVEANAITPPTSNPPPTPTGFNATAASSSEINLSWDAVAGASGYILERKHGSDPYSTIQANLTNNGFSDTGLAANTQYDYRLYSKNASGVSLEVEASASTLANPPSAPTGFVAEAVSGTEIALSWDGVDGASSYMLERKTGALSYSVLQDNLTDRLYADFGLSPNTLYSYRLRAKNNGGESETVEASATTEKETSPPPPPPPPPASLLDLKVSTNNRFLETSNGKTFFMLSDVAWSIFSVPTYAEAEEYLQKRLAQRFNTIIAAIVWEFEWEGPNANGDRSFEYLFPNAADERSKGRDPAKPVEAYFKYVDKVIAQANQLGFYMGLAPVWNNYLGGPNGWRVPLGYNVDKAKQYGRYLGSRYQNSKVFWVLGADDPLNTVCPPPGLPADFSPCTTAEQRKPLWNAMAQGLREVVGNKHLITFHPGGSAGTARTYISAEPWHNFHSQQSGHQNYFFTSRIHEDYYATPTKPVFDLEPLFEDSPLNLNPANGYSNASDVRRIAYWNVFSGAAGHSYAHHSVVQFWAPGRRSLNSPIKTWREGLSATGAEQMRYLWALVESRPFGQTVPDLTILTNGAGSGVDTVRALRAPNFAMVYTPKPRNLVINLGKLTGNQSGQTLAAWWYSPRSGTATRIGEFPGTGEQSFTAPTSDGTGLGADWVLVLDHKAAGYGAPGQ
jgi:fibronectin type 3 domain-containing protein